MAVRRSTRVLPETPSTRTAPTAVTPTPAEPVRVTPLPIADAGRAAPVATAPPQPTAGRTAPGAVPDVVESGPQALIRTPPAVGGPQRTAPVAVAPSGGVQRARPTPVDPTTLPDTVNVGNAAAPPAPISPAAAGVPQEQLTETQRLQNESIKMLQGAAAGSAPSVSEAQLVAAMNRAAATQMGIAAGARGADALAMQREAAITAGQQGLEAGAAAAAGRAAEMTGAREALAGAVGQARGQDIDLYTKLAGLKAQRDNLELELTAAANEGNQNRVAELQKLKLQLQTAETIANGELMLKARGLDLQAELGRRGLTQQWAIAMENNDTSTLNAIIQGITTGAGIAFKASDERLKTNVSAVPNDKLGDFANRIAEAIYTYDRKDTGKSEVGTMAQTVAGAGPLGQEVTGEVMPGVMGVDYGRLATLMAAAALRSQKERS